MNSALGKSGRLEEELACDKMGAEMTLDDVLDSFGDLLRNQGYNTKELVIELMRNIKREVAEEWTGHDRGA